jgi:hypothetical protein
MVLLNFKQVPSMNKDPNNDDKSKEYRKRGHVSFGLGMEHFSWQKSHDHITSYDKSSPPSECKNLTKYVHTRNAALCDHLRIRHLFVITLSVTSYE